jgi:hypothetical protein
MGFRSLINDLQVRCKHLLTSSDHGISIAVSTTRDAVRSLYNCQQFFGAWLALGDPG